MEDTQTESPVMHRLLLPLVCLAILILPAGLQAQDSTHKAPKIKRNPDLISEQEIQAAPEAWQTGFALVQRVPLRRTASTLRRTSGRWAMQARS